MTYFLLVAVALAIGGIGFLLRRRSTALGQGLILVSCLGLVGILGWQVRGSFSAGDAKPPNRAHAVVSFYLANQTQTAIAGHRGVVVMVLPPAGALDAETAESYANALRAPLLRGHPEWELEIARLDAPTKAARAGKIPLAAFQQLTARYPAALAFVCLAPVPPDIESLFPSESKTTKPWFLFDPQGSTNWVKALKEKRIRSVIVPRPDVNPRAAAGLAGMPGEIFDRLYLLATPETVERVAAQLSSANSK
ncbi:MAG TPA: hypothetical protein PLT00_07330 [Verrucomicrobiota bacterium]|jgi:hypothetical protein|nr:MAG: hypothetical protein BWX84_01550 [Verrucomicrobia bacterium ADurb.Bin118]HPY31037.1 hypothetical protein [Verrucomicrobiota bacterium]HQB16509.1 hypothetical protein [Verrucomicrobiota bacterium]